jgi:diguanylate cyclase (GGDEF)-like protein
LAESPLGDAVNRPLHINRQKPRRGVAWLFLVASVLGLALAGFIAISAQDVSRSSTPLIREKLPLLEDLGQVEKSLLSIQTSHHEYFAYSVNRKTYFELLDKYNGNFLDSMARLDKAFPGAPRLARIREVYDNSRKIAPNLDTLMQVDPVDWDEARAVLVEISIDSGEIDGQLKMLRQAVDADVIAAGHSTEHNVARMVWLVSAYSVLIFLIALLVAHHIRARARAESKLAYNAQHDLVTRRLNRRALEDTIATLGEGRQVLTMLALERFSRLVGTLGHEVADAALRAVAERLMRYAETLGAQVFRLDGANFALLYPAADLAQKTPADDAAEILALVRAPLHVGQYELLIAASCGVAAYPDDGNDALTLMRNANTALEHAQRGELPFLAYTPALNARSADRLAMEAALGHAVERNEFELHYQAQMAIRSGRVIGVEALIRWRRDGKLVSPIDFIPIAEESGLIVGIGEWVLREACRQSAVWRGLGHDLLVAVNISARQFQDPAFFDTVLQALADTGVEPAAIELEITESLIMQNPESVAGDLRRLRELGFALAIDDFGTGHSSLAYLKRFPIHKLKIDQSFVRNLGSCADDSAIVEAIIRLGQSLGLTVIAEGVETEENLKQLRDLGCDEIQGYLLSKPLPAAEATTFLQGRL